MSDPINAAINFVINMIVSVLVTWTSSKTITPLANYTCNKERGGNKLNKNLVQLQY